VIRFLHAFAREAWDGQSDLYRELQETRLQMARQQEYITEVLMGAKAAEVRVRQIWERERCLRLWWRAHQEYCMARWQQAKCARQIVPIQTRREATA